MPSNEPVLTVNNENYPPEIGRATVDLISRVPFIVRVPVSSQTPDGTLLWTCPSDRRALVVLVGIESTVSWTGGMASAIGLSSDDPNLSTKGDLLGDAIGELQADLVAGLWPAREIFFPRVTSLAIIGPGKSIRFDRIVSAFTAGAGAMHAQLVFVPST